MTEQPALARAIGLPWLTLYGMGTIIGAGIYVLIGPVAARAGMYTPLAFVLAAIVAGFTALAYAELSSRMPFSAGEAAYVSAATGRTWAGGVVGWLVASVGLISSATLATGMVGYGRLFLALPEGLLVVAFILLLGALAIWGIAESVAVAVVTTLIEVGGLALVVFLAGASLGDLPTRWGELVPPLEGAAWSGIGLGAFLAFFAYLGVEDIVNVAEEVRRPKRNLPLAIGLAMGISTLLYVLVALTAILTLPVETLGSAGAPLASVVQARAPGLVWFIGGIGLVATINGAVIQMIMASRVVYGLATRGGAPRFFSVVHPVTRTPVRATLAVMGLQIVLALWLPIDTLAQATTTIMLVVFVAVNLALIVLKTRGPTPADAFACPAWVPWAGALSSIGLLVAQTVL